MFRLTIEGDVAQHSGLSNGVTSLDVSFLYNNRPSGINLVYAHC